MAVEPDLVVKQGDTWPAIGATLTEKVGGTVKAIDLTSAEKVKAIMKAWVGEKPSGAASTKECTFVNRTKGEVSIPITEGVTTTAGEWAIEFEIQWTSTHFQTVPNSGYRILSVQADLGGSVG